MNRFILLAGFLAALLSGAGLSASIATAAETEVPMTEAHIERIRSNCVDAQSTLSQLHASDALLRVNRGQLYESISTKLMAPLNSRIAMNKLDGASLVSITVDYEVALDKFRTNYQSYEETLAQVLEMKCTDQPVSFYDGVRSARDKRAKVYGDTETLQMLIKKYKTAFELFTTKTLKGTS